MVTVDFRLKVEICPFHICTMKNMQYSPYLWPNHRNFRIFKEIGVEEHNGVVRFLARSGNKAVSQMHNKKYAKAYLWPNCRNYHVL